MSLQPGNKILDRVAPKTSASKSNSAIEAGHTKSDKSSAPPNEAIVDAIMQVFTLFRLNYHNQFFAAYSESESLQQVQKLWLSSLKNFSAESILRAAKRAIEESEYLPTLNKMLSYMDSQGLPDTYSAYREACLAPSPKAENSWSHAAVYLAGRDSDWFFLANNSEKISRPVFEKHYQHWRERALAGETLDIDRPLPIEKREDPALKDAERAAAIAKIRSKHGL